MEKASQIWLFVDCSVICELVMLFVFWRFFQNRISLPLFKNIRLMILGSMAFVGMDCYYSLVLWNYVPLRYDFLYYFAILYNLVTFGSAMLWFRYTELRLKKTSHAISKFAWACAVIFVLFSISAVVLKSTDLFMYEENGQVKLGVLDSVWYFFEYMPVVCMALLAGRYYFDKRYILLKESCAPLLFCAIIFLVFGFGQFIFVDWAIYEMGVTLSVLFLNQSMSNTLIAVDELTGLKNRRQFLRDMNDLVKNKEGNWCLYMGDIDLFKDINSRYGHLEGDIAVVTVANTLNNVCLNAGASLYRYGGDEFCIVKHLLPKENPNDFLDEVIAEIKKMSIANNKPFRLHLCFGSVCFRDCNSKELSEVIRLADEDLSRAKRSFDDASPRRVYGTSRADISAL